MKKTHPRQHAARHGIPDGVRGLAAANGSGHQAALRHTVYALREGVFLG